MGVRILILGGGFGGVYTALSLEQLLKRELRDGRVELGLVSRDNYIVFQPMLPEVISGSIGIIDTMTPIRRLCPSTNLIDNHSEFRTHVETAAKPGVGPRRLLAIVSREQLPRVLRLARVPEGGSARPRARAPPHVVSSVGVSLRPTDWPEALTSDERRARR